jgi:thiamine kinase-like enzyme
VPAADVPAEALARIGALPLWHGRIAVEPLSGGITNRNYLVNDAVRRAVVRLGADIPVHGVLRFNELAASRAAAAAGISPAVIASAPGILVLEFVEGRTLGAADLRADRGRVVALVKRAHRDIPRHLEGPILAFDAFRALRGYARALTETHGRTQGEIAPLMRAAEALEAAAGTAPPVFGHNDLLAANVIDDGTRLWLIDWDYAGFATPLFDLGGLSANNGFDEAMDEAMLAAYFEHPPNDELRRRFRAMRCAALLREAMWSMVSETQSALDFDYAAYTAENLARFSASWAALEETAR